jgi:hypothetical protein
VAAAARNAAAAMAKSAAGAPRAASQATSVEHKRLEKEVDHPPRGAGCVGPLASRGRCAWRRSRGSRRDGQQQRNRFAASAREPHSCAAEAAIIDAAKRRDDAAKAVEEASARKTKYSTKYIYIYIYIYVYTFLYNALVLGLGAFG